jgi:single-strand DNA-binding protein
MANNITLTGRLTAKPELKTTQTGVAVCSFTLAVRRPHQKDVTDFIPCQAWRKNAEFLTTYADKGNLTGVTGVLATRKWQDKDGNNRIAYEVICDSVELLESKASGEANNSTAQPTYIPDAYTQQRPQAKMEELSDDEELPF